MSDLANASSSTNAPPPAPSKPTESRLRRWRRRLGIAVIVLVAVVILVRAATPIVLPMVLNRIASRYNITLNYERAEMYLSSASVGLWHLKLTPRGQNSDSAIETGYCRADVSLLNLLKGKIVVYRLEADDVTANLERKENGEIPLLTELVGGPQAAPKSTPAAAAAQRDLDLDPPIRIDSLRASEIHAHIVDRAVTPSVVTDLNVSMRLSDVGSSMRPVSFSLDVTSPPILDALRVEGEGTAKGKNLDAHMQVALRGLHPRPAAGYLVAMGLKPTGESISAQMVAVVKTEPFAAPPAAGSAAATTPTPPNGIKGSIALSGITAVTDGVEAAGVDQVSIGIDQLMFDRIKLGTVAIENVRANAKRTPEGNIRVAGIDLVGAPPSNTPTVTSSSPLPAWSVRELRVRNVKANFQDQAVSPAANLAVLVDQAGLKNLASDASEMPTDISLVMSIPGIAQSVHASGAARPIGAKKTLDVKVVAEGVRPDALKPYLDAAGVASQLKNGTLTCDLHAALAQGADGTFAADAKVDNVKFTDGGDLFAFEGMTLAGATIDPKANRFRVETIDIVGPTISASRNKAGLVGSMGFMQKPAESPASAATAASAVAAAPTTAPASAAVAAAPASSSVPPLKLEVGQLTWRGAALRFDDQAMSPPVTVALGDTGVEMNDLKFDFDPHAAAAGTPGKIRAWLTAPGIAGKIAVNGTVAPSPSAITLDLDLSGQNLRAGQLTGYIQALGIKPELRDGAVQSHAHIALARRDDGVFTADVALSNVKYADGAQELAGVDGLKVNGAALHPDGVSINEIVIDKPRGRAMRDADGTFVVGGVRLLATTQPATANSAPVAPATSGGPASAGPSSQAKLPVIALNKLTINDAGLTWIDKAIPHPVDATARANVQLDNFVFGKPGAQPANLKVAVTVPQTVQSINVGGVVLASLDAPMAKLDISATGIQQGWVASYLPPGMKMNLADGRLKVKLDAAAPVVPQGGRAVRLVVTDMDYRDGAQGQPLLKFDSAKLLASRVDPIDGKVIAVDEVSLAGLEMSARKASDGTIRALGLTIGPPPAQQQTSFAGGGGASAAGAQTAAAQLAPAPAPTAAAPAAPAPAPTTNVAELMAQERVPLPLVTLQKLDINLHKVSYVDETRPEASPIDLADVSVRNRKPIEALGPDSQSRPPIEIETTGRIDPIVQTFNVAAVTAPFASQPTLTIDVTAAGIKGDGILAAAPELKQQIDGSNLTDGRFTTHLEATAKFARRGAVRFDFGKPFEAEFSIRPLEYRSAPEGPILAGLEEIRGEGIRVDPATGGVIVRTLDVTKPMGNVWRDKDGVHVLGLVLKPTTQPAATTQPEKPEPSMAQQPQPAPVTHGPAEAGSPEKPVEIRVDRLLVNGIDFRAEDRTMTPMLIVPLDSLDVEVQNLSNLALTQADAKPIRFNVIAGAGKVPLEGKKEKELFSEVTANGNLSLYPAPQGYAKASVSGLELLGLAGAANEAGVKLGGGVFDGTFDARFQSGGDIDSHARLAITDLKISEPPNGPIQQSLKLNMPLDAVIVLLEDASGAITLPLQVPLKHGEISKGAVKASASGAAAQVVGTAIASSPLKVAGGVTNVLGLGGKGKETGEQPAGEVDFAAADTQLSPEAQAKLTELIERMRKQGKLELTVKHQLGGEDLARAAVLANPSSEQCAALAEQIRSRKLQLLQSRQQLAGAAKAQLASGSTGEAQITIEELRGVDRELAAAEDALDRVYDLLRPGADRQADRRTRAVALVIAQQRLEAVHAALLAAGGPKLDDRIRVTRAQFTEPQQADSEGKITFTVLEKKKP